MKDVETLEKGKLIKSALRIVDELGKIDWDDMGEEDMEHLEALNKRAKKLTRDTLWKLS